MWPNLNPQSLTKPSVIFVELGDFCRLMMLQVLLPIITSRLAEDMTCLKLSKQILIVKTHTLVFTLYTLAFTLEGLSALTSFQPVFINYVKLMLAALYE